MLSVSAHMGTHCIDRVDDQQATYSCKLNQSQLSGYVYASATASEHNNLKKQSIQNFQ